MVFPAALRADSLEIQTVDGKKYEQVVVISQTALQVSFTYSDGVATLPFSSLTEESKRALGYDAAKASTATAEIQAAQKERAKEQAIEQAKIAAEDAKLRAIRARLREDAGRALLLASREDQLKAALIRAAADRRGGRPFSAMEFMYFSQEYKEVIVTYVPDLMPNELLPKD